MTNMPDFRTSNSSSSSSTFLCIVFHHSSISFASTHSFNFLCKPNAHNQQRAIHKHIRQDNALNPPWKSRASEFFFHFTHTHNLVHTSSLCHKILSNSVGTCVCQINMHERIHARCHYWQIKHPLFFLSSNLIRFDQICREDENSYSVVFQWQIIFQTKNQNKWPKVTPILVVLLDLASVNSAVIYNWSVILTVCIYLAHTYDRVCVYAFQYYTRRHVNHLLGNWK